MDEPGHGAWCIMVLLLSVRYSVYGALMMKLQQSENSTQIKETNDIYDARHRTCGDCRTHKLDDYTRVTMTVAAQGNFNQCTN